MKMKNGFLCVHAVLKIKRKGLITENPKHNSSDDRIFAKCMRTQCFSLLNLNQSWSEAIVSDIILLIPTLTYFFFPLKQHSSISTFGIRGRVKNLMLFLTELSC